MTKPYSLITAIIQKDKLQYVLSDTVKRLSTNIFSIKARGTLLRTEWYQYFLPNMHPELEILQLISPKQNCSIIIDDIILNAKITQYGMGAVFSQDCQDIYFSNEINVQTPSIKSEKNHKLIKKNLMAIFCIIQKDKAENIVKKLIKIGSPSPTIMYGRGHGIRDRLGLLRIAINPEKEFIFIVTDKIDSLNYFEKIIDYGKLYVPGEGFIYMLPVNKGLINLQTTYISSNQTASLTQIITAIDELKGNTEWRKNNQPVNSVINTNFERQYLEELTRITCLVPRGFGDTLISFILELDVSGASMFYGKECGKESTSVNKGISLTNEKEIIEMTLDKGMIKKTIQYIQSFIEQHNITDGLIYTHLVDRAFTYID